MCIYTYTYIHRDGTCARLDNYMSVTHGAYAQSAEGLTQALVRRLALARSSLEHARLVLAKICSPEGMLTYE